MKFTTSISIVFTAAIANIFVSAAPSNAIVPVELRAADNIVCGTCAFDNTYCDAGGSYHLCYGQAGCGGATACPGGCYWDVGNPDYNGQAQC
ncbi:hypothetical protein N431DRAFT_429909 [Stipitochalara longipes BDJ]|nr:hypothetical protein N431DRAFT_429909 [Stipitochalara longipes BDJ]